MALPSRRSHENHESFFMPGLIRPIDERGNTGVVTSKKEICMKWETPAAIEMRFGMEITMYVANR